MARTRATFRQADIVRAVKAAQACGLVVARIEISKDGGITLSRDIRAPDTRSAAERECDEWEARYDARQAQGN